MFDYRTGFGIEYQNLFNRVQIRGPLDEGAPLKSGAENRRGTPRTKVPAGAVALAGEFAGVYPRESPGGWQLLGHTPLKMWDLDRDPPALLVPGTVVRFVEAS